MRALLRTLPTLVATVIVVALVGCAAPPPATTGEQAPAFSAPPAAQRVRRFELDPARSALTVLVMRSGTLAALGHNHTVEARGLRGTVLLAEPFAASSVEFAFPVDALVVDDTDARAAAGADFPGVPPAEAIAGTRHNLLGSALLDALAHPEVRVHSTALAGRAPRIWLELAVEVKGMAHRLAVPCTLTLERDTLEVSGEVEVDHAALGLVPFRALGGALAVADRMRIRFHAVAIAER